MYKLACDGPDCDEEVILDEYQAMPDDEEPWISLKKDKVTHFDKTTEEDVTDAEGYNYKLCSLNCVIELVDTLQP